VTVPRIPREEPGLKKGSSRKPDRQRKQNPNKGRKPGDEKVGGKQPSSPKIRVTRDLCEVLWLAGEMHGSDGLGKDGIIGSVYRLIKNHPEIYGRLLEKMLPAQVKADVNTTTNATPERLSREELIERLRERGITLSSINLDKSQYRSLPTPLPTPEPSQEYRNGGGAAPGEPQPPQSDIGKPAKD
jgi:hypothetical protein